MTASVHNLEAQDLILRVEGNPNDEGLMKFSLLSAVVPFPVMKTFELDRKHFLSAMLATETREMSKHSFLVVM